MPSRRTTAKQKKHLKDSLSVSPAGVETFGLRLWSTWRKEVTLVVGGIFPLKELLNDVGQVAQGHVCIYAQKNISKANKTLKILSLTWFCNEARSMQH